MLNLTFQEHINNEHKNIIRYLDLLGDKVEWYKVINEDYSRCDLIFKIRGKSRIFLAEFKTRDIHYTLYRDSLLESDKIPGIENQAKQLGYDNPRLLFVVSYNDGSMFHFNMKKYDRTGAQKCPKHTSIDGISEMVIKDCIYFNLNTENRII
jgi:hypothetical protein